MENENIEAVEEIKDPQAVLNALDRAKNDAKKFREEKEALEKQIESKNEQIAKYSNKLLKEKVQKEIDKLNIANNERIFKYLKLESLHFDDDFNINGLEDQIDVMKTDFPELFDSKLLVAGKGDSASAIPVKKPISASEKQAMFVLGR